MDRQGTFAPPASVRRLLLVAFGILVSLGFAPAGSAWAQVGSARYSSIVVDARTGRILMGVNPDALRFPASLTKLMTLYMTFEALRDRRIAGAGIDVFDLEPPPADHPFRMMDNVTLTPHLGYVTRETLRVFYGAMPEAIAAFARGAPVRVANPDALKHAKQGARGVK